MKRSPPEPSTGLLLLRTIAVSSPELRTQFGGEESVAGAARPDDPVVEVLRSERIRRIRYMEPATKRTILTFGGALLDAGISIEELHREAASTGVVLGAIHGPTATRRKFAEGFHKRGEKAVSATLFAQCGYNMIGAILAIAYGIKGANLTMAGGRDLGAVALSRAISLLKLGRLRHAIVGTYEFPGPGDTPESVIMILSRTDGLPVAGGVQLRLTTNRELFEEDDCGLHVPSGEESAEPFSPGSRVPVEVEPSRFDCLVHLGQAYSRLKGNEPESSRCFVAANSQSGGLLLELVRKNP